MGAIDVHIQWDEAGLSAVDRTLGTLSGAQLTKSIDKAIGKELRSLIGPLRAAEESSGITNRTGEHRRKIRARKPRKRPGEVSAWTVGPSDKKAHLLVQGHKVVGHKPRRVNTGKVARAFPYPGPVFDREEDALVERISSDVWAQALRS